VRCEWLQSFAAASAEIVFVDSAEEACLFVYSPSAKLEGAKVLGRTGTDPTQRNFKAQRRIAFRWERDLAHWSAAGAKGRNHLLILPEHLVHPDYVGTLREWGSTGEAIFAAASAWPGLFRPGFDIVITPKVSHAIAELVHAWPTPFLQQIEKAGELRPSAGVSGLQKYAGDRPILVSFAGTTYGRNRWYDSRVLAAAYSHDPPNGVEVYVFKKGGNPGRCVPSHTMPNRTYVDTLRRSSFVFAPGGAGPYTFRLIEAMAAGAVPVVTADMLLPFEGTVGLEWDTCAVRLSYAELRELRATLLAIAPPGFTAFRNRLVACRAIYEQFMLGGTPTFGQTADAYRSGTSLAFWTEVRARVGAAAVRARRGAHGSS